MRTEFNATDMNIRVRRDEDGNETTATVSFTDENGNTLVGRLDAEVLRNATNRFTTEATAENLKAFGPTVNAFQEAVATACVNLEGQADLLLNRLATAAGATPNQLAKASRDFDNTLENAPEPTPENTTGAPTEPMPSEDDIPDVNLDGNEEEVEVRRMENNEVVTNL